MDCPSISPKMWLPNPEAQLPLQREGTMSPLTLLCAYIAVRGTDLVLSPLQRAVSNPESKSCSSADISHDVFCNELVFIIQALHKLKVLCATDPSLSSSLEQLLFGSDSWIGFSPSAAMHTCQPSFPQTCLLHPGAKIHNPPLSCQQCPFRRSVRTLASRPSFSLMLVKHHLFPPSSHVGACNFHVEYY